MELTYRARYVTMALAVITAQRRRGGATDPTLHLEYTRSFEFLTLARSY